MHRKWNTYCIILHYEGAHRALRWLIIIAVPFLVTLIAMAAFRWCRHLRGNLENMRAALFKYLKVIAACPQKYQESYPTKVLICFLHLLYLRGGSYNKVLLGRRLFSNINSLVFAILLRHTYYSQYTLQAPYLSDTMHSTHADCQSFFVIIFYWETY
jgi:hypothetical protein